MFIEEKHRGKGQTQPLINGLLDTAKGKGVYATTRRANEKMQRILKHQHFAPHGDPYASIEHPDEEIILLILSAKKPASKASR